MQCCSSSGLVLAETHAHRVAFLSLSVAEFVARLPFCCPHSYCELHMAHVTESASALSVTAFLHCCVTKANAQRVRVLCCAVM
jgi:hypothetical protein